MKNFLLNNLIAHRGLHNKYILENTLPSFSKCIDRGYIIELDIHILKDKTIVVYHDYNLYRLTGVNKIIETLTFPEIKKIRIKNKYIIPTLKQVLSLVDGKVPILIEVKDLNTNCIFEEELSKILDGYTGLFAIQSLNYSSIKWFHKYKKNYIIGYVILNKFNYKILKSKFMHIDFISVNKKNLPIKIKNKYVLGWTIKNNHDFLYYRPLCDNLICEKIL